MCECWGRWAPLAWGHSTSSLGKQFGIYCSEYPSGFTVSGWVFPDQRASKDPPPDPSGNRLEQGAKFHVFGSHPDNCLENGLQRGRRGNQRPVSRGVSGLGKNRQGPALRPLRRRKARSPLLKLPWTGASAPVQGEEDLGWQLGDREEAMALRAAPSRAPSYLARFPQDASALRAPSALSPDQGQHGLCGVPGLRE